VHARPQGRQRVGRAGWAGARARLAQARARGGQVRRERRQLAQLREQVHPALPGGRVALRGRAHGHLAAAPAPPWPLSWRARARRNWCKGAAGRRALSRRGQSAAASSKRPSASRCSRYRCATCARAPLRQTTEPYP